MHRRSKKNLLSALLIAGGLTLIAFHLLGKTQAALHQYRLSRAYYVDLSQADPPLMPLEGMDPRDNGTVITVNHWAFMRLFIPKIGTDLIVIRGDVFSKEYLDRAPVHYQMSASPGTQAGNVAIAGHRAGVWNYFLRLDELEAGDKIFLEVAGYRFVYIVQWVKVVQPDDWSVIQPTDYPALTLTTCEPKNRPATHRLVVRSQLEEVLSIAAGEN